MLPLFQLLPELLEIIDSSSHAANNKHLLHSNLYLNGDRKQALGLE
jgi:hypothetical protein